VQLDKKSKKKEQAKKVLNLPITIGLYVLFEYALIKPNSFNEEFKNRIIFMVPEKI
jgi:hypothetical protein